MSGSFISRSASADRNRRSGVATSLSLHGAFVQIPQAQLDASGIGDEAYLTSGTLSDGAVISVLKSGAAFTITVRRRQDHRGEGQGARQARRVLNLQPARMRCGRRYGRSDKPTIV